MIDIATLTILDARAGLRRGTFRSVDLVSACFANIKKYNARYNALLTVYPEEELLAAAQIVDKHGYDLPLAGIPVVLKDMYSTEGNKTTAGSKVLEQYISVYDAT
ncbi:MAG: amidase family protein, partial [bacterium]|nr:amidase family protein [bacterium]